MQKLTLGLKLSEIGGLKKFLPLINYSTKFNKFVYQTDDSNNMQVDNRGKVKSKNDLLLNAGRAVELGATNDVDIPIHHTLGADTKQTATVDTGWVDNGSHSYTATLADTAISDLSSETGDNFLISFTVSSYSAGSIEGYSADGTYEVESTTESLTGTGFSGTVLINSVKQITTPDSFLTYYDITDEEFVQLGNSVDGGSSKNEYINYDFNIDDSVLWSGFYDVFAWSSGEYNIAREAADGRVKYSLPLKSNTYYLITYVAKSNTGVPLGIRAGLTTTNYNQDQLELRQINTTTTEVSVICNSLTDHKSLTMWTSSTNSDITFYSASIKEILPISQTYTFNDQTINNLMPTHTAFSASDLAKLNANPNLLAKLAKSETGSIEELDMVLVGDEPWYACSEGSGATLHDARGSGTATISNAVDTIWSNADQQTVGLQTTCLTLDGAGVPTAYREDALECHGNEFGDTQWNPSGAASFWIEEIIDGVVYQHKYDGVNLTTYTDNVAGTTAAHSPENADYIVGKGVYPKVAGDPYTENVVEYFNVFVDNYTSYDQSARYAILAAI